MKESHRVGVMMLIVSVGKFILILYNSTIGEWKRFFSRQSVEVGLYARKYYFILVDGFLPTQSSRIDRILIVYIF